MDTSNIKVICFDMDGTLTKGNTWYDFNMIMGVDPEYDLEMYNQYIEGTLAYDDWTDKLRAEYKKVSRTREEIEKKLFEVIFVDDAKETIEELKRCGYTIAMITGSFDVTAFKVGEALGITHVIANTKCLFNPDGTFMDIVSYGDEQFSKVTHLKYLLELLKLDSSECSVVGDGSNDIELFRYTGNGICFNHSSPRTRENAKETIESLPDLLKIFP